MYQKRKWKDVLTIISGKIRKQSKRLTENTQFTEVAVLLVMQVAFYALLKL